MIEYSRPSAAPGKPSAFVEIPKSTAIEVFLHAQPAKRNAVVRGRQLSRSSRISPLPRRFASAYSRPLSPAGETHSAARRLPEAIIVTARRLQLMFAFVTFAPAYSPHLRCRASLNPLEDRRVLIAAPRAYAAQICPRLIEKSARPIHAPLISNKPLPDAEIFELEEAILRLSDYDIIAFVCTTAIEVFAQKLRAICELNDQALLMLRASRVRFATLGTNGLILKQILGVTPDILSPDPSPEGLADYLTNDDSLRGSRVLCPIPKFIGAPEPRALSEFKKRMARARFDVSSVLAYKVMPIERERINLELKLLLDGNIDALLISDETEASALWALLSEAERDTLLNQVQKDKTFIIAHGSDTAAAATAVLGFRKVTTSQDWSSYQGVIGALEEKLIEARSGDGLLLPS